MSRLQEAPGGLLHCSHPLTSRTPTPIHSGSGCLHHRLGSSAVSIPRRASPTPSLHLLLQESFPSGAELRYWKSGRFPISEILNRNLMCPRPSGFPCMVFFFVINNFFNFFFYTQHNIISKIQKKKNRHVLNISRSNQKGGGEGRTTRTQKSLLYTITYVQQKTLPSINGRRPGPTDSRRCTFT